MANIFIWLLTFIVYQKQKKHFDSGGFLLLFYLSISIVGMHLFNQPLAAGWFEEIVLFPFLYLYTVMMMITLPILKFDDKTTTCIQQPSAYTLNIIYIIIIIASVFQIVSIFGNFSTGLSNMLVNSDAGAEMYRETLSKADTVGDGQIENLAAIISGMFSNISILLLFYALTRENKNKFVIIGLSISVILLVLSSIADGARGGIVNVMLTVVITYILLRNFMSYYVRKVVKRIGIVMIILISVPFMLITSSRFANSDSFDTFFSMEYYYGQSFLNFNNYGLDAGGIRNGDRTAALFKQMIWEDTPRNYLERRSKYSHMKMDESVFYTFVGDFTLDYGPMVSFFIFALASLLFIRKTRIKNECILFHQLVLLFFIACVCVQGTMTLFSFSDIGGNLNIVTFVLIYFWFKTDYYRQQRLNLWQE